MNIKKLGKKCNKTIKKLINSPIFHNNPQLKRDKSFNWEILEMLTKKSQNVFSSLMDLKNNKIKNKMKPKQMKIKKKSKRKLKLIDILYRE